MTKGTQTAINNGEGHTGGVVLVATHKDYRFPDDKVYMPIKIGAKQNTFRPDLQEDSTCDNISLKNPNYCELTALYWGWKNLPKDVSFVGLCHYRRHFTTSSIIKYKLKGKWNSIVSDLELEKLIFEYPVILPNKRRYYIESNESHYIHSHEKEPLEQLKQIIKDDYPRYYPSLNRVLNRTWAHMFNMAIMRRDIFNSYAKWLFEVLEKVEKRVDISGYSEYESRVFGFLSEIMLDTYIDEHSIPYKEINSMFMEKQNWPKKITQFLLRKVRKSQKKSEKVRNGRV